jgi:hypothetical protein
MRRRARWELITQRGNDHLARWREALLERIERLGDSQRRAGASGRLPLILIRDHLLAGTSDRRGEADEYRLRLERTLAAALATAPPIDAGDLRFWFGEPGDPPPAKQNGPALQALLGIDAGAWRGILGLAGWRVSRGAPGARATHRGSGTRAGPRSGAGPGFASGWSRVSPRQSRPCAGAPARGADLPAGGRSREAASQEVPQPIRVTGWPRGWAEVSSIPTAR